MRMLVDELKKQVMQAVKAHDDVARDVLRLALGEIQTAEARTNRALDDDEAASVVRKLVKSNEETLAISQDAAQKATLSKEITALVKLLPKALDGAQIVAALAPVHAAVRAAANEGQATGVAMKHLKASGAAVNGTDVAKAVKEIRAGS